MCGKTSQIYMLAKASYVDLTQELGAALIATSTPTYEQYFSNEKTFPITAECQSLINTVHKTQAAAEKHNDMWCYTCHTMESGDMCVENITANYSSFMKKCRDEEFTCMVQRFSYTTSTENSTSSPKMWSLERKCTAHCESGCIVIGERTKLYACTSCCKTPFCNTGRSAADQKIPLQLWMLLLLAGAITVDRRLQPFGVD